jgi:hypothetical protein
MIGVENDNEVITQLWQTIKERLWLCFDALRVHKNRFKSSLMVGLNDSDAQAAFDIELEKCYNNRFNAARAFYYRIQQNIVS